MSPGDVGQIARTINNFAPLLWALALLSPLAASLCAASFYARHRRTRPDPGRHLPILGYIALLLIGAVVAFPIGVAVGIGWGCSLPNPGNLCGLWGFFVVGPFASGVGIFLVGWLISRLPADV